MRFLRKRVLAGEVLAGTFCNLGSPITTEIAGRAGFDWLLLDLEHGAGDQSELMHQLQAAGAADTPALVRIAWNEPWRFKRVLDAGAAGVMVPWVSTPEEARAAAQATRYFPDGVRGAGDADPRQRLQPQPRRIPGGGQRQPAHRGADRDLAGGGQRAPPSPRWMAWTCCS